jgi:hypothetical protein
VFYAPSAFPELGIESNSLPERGAFSPQSFAVAYRNRRRDYTGYILLNDDSIIDPFLLNEHDLDRVGCEDTFVGRNSRLGFWDNWRIYGGVTGWERQQNWYADICNDTRYSWMQTCRIYAKGGHGEGMADFFYVPGVHARLFAELVEKCTEHHVWLERCVASISISFPFVNLGRLWTRYNWSGHPKDHIAHYHPVKFSNPLSVEFLKRFINLTEERERLRRVHAAGSYSK